MSLTTDERTEVDLTDAELYRHGFPHEVFTRLRHDDPVHWQAFADDSPSRHDPGFWVLTRHSHIQAASRDAELFCSYDGPTLGHQPEMRGIMLVSMDGPAHIRQRRLISAGFTPRMVRKLDEQIRAWAIDIVDRALEMESCDFVGDVAYRLPMHVISDIVGIPVEDRDWLFSLTTEFLRASDPESETTLAEQRALQLRMFEYAQELGRAKRADPGDDIWSNLSTVEVADGDGNTTALSQVELDLFFLLLIGAGSETTRNALSLGMLTLVDHPDQMALLREQPDLIAAATEEILRWSSPVTCFARRATRATEIGGVTIAEGDRVTLWYPSGNRDEDVFEDPFRFDVRRTPNPHITFGGGGVHFCLGANLARREILILLEELLARTREIEVVGPPAFSALGIFNPILLAMRELPVRLA